MLLDILIIKIVPPVLLIVHARRKPSTHIERPLTGPVQAGISGAQLRATASPSTEGNSPSQTECDGP